jgi:spore coat polysaccharide biosynthesis protein SpsF
MNIVGIVQARMTSSRLPGKILKEIQGQSLLEINLNRIKQSKKIERLILATTDLPTDDQTQMLGQSIGISVYRGSENDVLDRFYQAIIQNLNEKPQYIVRLTADCPLIDSTLIDKIIEKTINSDLDYCSNTLNPMYPDGQDVEVFKFTCLEKAWKEAKLQSEREHVTPYIWKNSTAKGGNIFVSDNFSDTVEDFSNIRMTVDEPSDFEVIKQIIVNLGTNRNWLDYAIYLKNNEVVRSLNEDIKRNQGYEKSINIEQ